MRSVMTTGIGLDADRSRLAPQPARQPITAAAAAQTCADAATSPARRLRVLLVCHWFPPLNVIGAVRSGKFAKYLHEAGHDVRVLTANVSGDHSLPLEIPANLVTYVTARRASGILEPAVSLVRHLRRGSAPTAMAERSAAPTAAPFSSRLTQSLRRHYYAVAHMPDPRAPWMRAATRIGYEIVREWHPDIIIASAPPNSALIVAARLARASGAPWVAEFRDLWADNPYYEEPLWRLWLDRYLERSALKSAAILVTVTPIWADILRRHHRQPVVCIFNGYVEEDFPAERVAPPPGEVVSIVYTGNIYSGYRDPSPLFRAIELIGTDRNRIAVHFYGPDAQDVYGLAAAAAVQEQIFVHDRVSYSASLALQASADVLLLLQWADPRDAGNIPAKFFEYLGAGRPILMLGYEHGNLAEMIRTRDAGIVSNDPNTIADQLRRWIAQRTNGIPPVDARARHGMTRAEQFARLERFLGEVRQTQLQAVIP